MGSLQALQRQTGAKAPPSLQINTEALAAHQEVMAA